MKEHSHGHGHDHRHDGIVNVKVMRGVFFLNLGFSIFEFIAGAVLNSISIQADAVHDLGDALSVGLAWYFEKVSNKRSNHRYTFGYRRFSLLGALITSLVLVTGSASMILQAVPRLFDSEPVSYRGMTWIAIAAILINAAAAWLLSRGRGRNNAALNLHMLEDVLGWIGILVISLVMRWKPLYILDPIMSILIAAFILWRIIPQLLGTIRIMMESVPEGIDIAQIEDEIAAVPGVHGAGQLRIWTLDGEHINLSVIIYTDSADLGEHARIRDTVARIVGKEEGIQSTIQIEYDPERLNEGHYGHEEHDISRIV